MIENNEQSDEIDKRENSTSNSDVSGSSSSSKQSSNASSKKAKQQALFDDSFFPELSVAPKKAKEIDFPQNDSKPSKNLKLSPKSKLKTSPLEVTQQKSSSAESSQIVLNHQDDSLESIFSTEADDQTATSAHYQVVARRYRPQGFEQLIGQEHIATALSNAITTGRIGHAYLFTGARGVGKTSSARIFAKALNCVHGPTPNPCNQCEICESIGTGDDIDVLEIDGASNRGIDEIRQLRLNASVRPSRARYKIYIIDEVHMLTREAFNALLKTLEEPPEHVKFIFCTTEPAKIPITILSRCQRFDFAGIESSAIAARLGQIATQEGVTIEEGVCDILARRANGSMRDAQSLLEQLLSFAPKNIRLVDVYEMLGTVDDQKIFDLLNAMIQSQPAHIFAILNQAVSGGADFAVLIEQIMGIFRDLMAVASSCDSKGLLYVSPERFDELKSLADQFGIQRILASLQILDQTHQRMRYSTQSRILTELALIRLCYLDQLQQITKIIELLRQGKSVSVDSVEKKKSIEIDIKNESPVFSNAIHPEKHSLTDFSHSESKTKEDAQNIERIKDLSSMTNQQATEIWKSTFLHCNQSSLSMMTKSFSDIRFELPNLFVICFSSKDRLSYDYCLKETNNIQSLFQKNFEPEIHIKFELDPSLFVSQPQKPQNLVNNQKNQWQIFRETEEIPMVQKIIELFNAELKEVKSPPKKS